VNIKLKKFIASYGIKFIAFYFLSFFILTTFFARFKFQTFPGDILYKGKNFYVYLPFTSALAIAVFFLIIIEIYKNMR